MQVSTFTLPENPGDDAPLSGHFYRFFSAFYAPLHVFWLLDITGVGVGECLLSLNLPVNLEDDAPLLGHFYRHSSGLYAPHSDVLIASITWVGVGKCLLSLYLRILGMMFHL